jgi:hypothetical protein
MSARPLAWLLIAAAGAGGVALGLQSSETESPARPVGRAAAPPPTAPILQIIRLAAPSTHEEADADLRADIEALARRWQILSGQGDRGGATARQALWQDSLARLEPWLLREPRQLWRSLPRLGEIAPDLGEALVRSQLARKAQAALPHLEALAGLWEAQALPLYEQLLQQWAEQHLHAQAVQALDRAPLTADNKQALLQQVLARWAEASPEQAARWALATPGQSGLLAPLHDRWLQHDARAATVFASSLPPGETRQALLNDGLSRWTAQDGAGARDWLRAHAPQPELDQALLRHASSDELARHAPVEAMDLLARIASPEARWRAWQALARNLHDIDPEQAERLLSQAPGLGAAEQARLRESLQ